MYPLKQSTAITVPIFVHDGDGNPVTGILNAAFTKIISKNGAAFGAMTVTITEMQNGWYSLPLDTGHTNTLGVLTVTITHATAKQVNLQWLVNVSGGDANLVAIDGSLTTGNNATLNLKQLNVVNTTGSAIIATSSGSNGSGMVLTGNGTGHGLSGVGGTTSGVGIRAFSAGGNAMDIIASGNTNQHGLNISGSATGGTGYGMLVTGGTSDGLRVVGAAAAGAGMNAVATVAGGHGIVCNGVTTGSGFRAIGGLTGPGIEGRGGATGPAAGITGVGVGGNSPGISGVGQGTNAGLLATGGATGNGISANGGATPDMGILAKETGVSGHGLSCSAGTTTATGILVAGGATSGAGISITTTSGNGITSAPGGGNGHGMQLTGEGSGFGLQSTGGATGHGINAGGGITSGVGFRAAGVAGNSPAMSLVGQGSAAGLLATGGATGPGISANGGATSGIGILANGTGASGHALSLSAGTTTAQGLRVVAGATSGEGIFVSTTSGDGVQVTPTAGHAMNLVAQGTSKNGLRVVGGSTSGAGIDITATSGAGISSAGGTAGSGLVLVGAGAGHGVALVAGTTGNGMDVATTAGNGISVTPTAGHAMVLTGQGTAKNGLLINGGSTTGAGVQIVTTSGDGINVNATTGHGMILAANGAAKHGISATGGNSGACHGVFASSGSAGNGIHAAGTGTGHGLALVAGSTGNGMKVTTTAGDGVSITPTAGTGIVATGQGTSKHGAIFTGGTAGTSDGFVCAAGTGGVDLRAAITGSLSGSVGSVTGAVGSVTGAVGSVTAGVTVTTNNDKTGYSLTQTFPTNFASMSITAGGVVSANATQWAGTTIVATSIPVGTAAGSAGGLVVIGTGTNNFKSDASANVTFANTSIATVTTVTTTTNLTNLPAIPANWLTAAGIAAAALNGKGDWNIGKTGYSLTQTFPTNFASLSIDGSGLVNITQAAADKAWGTAARTLTAATNITSSGGTITTTAGVVSANATQWGGTTIVATSIPVGTAAGAAGGLFISGTNSGTTTVGALTVSGATTLTGNVSMAAGLTITNSTLNGHGIIATGNGTGSGMRLAAGATGSGMSVVSTAGDGISITPTAGHAILATANGTSKHGMVLTGGTAGTSDGFSCIAGTGGVPIRGNITGNLTGNVSGSVGSVTVVSDKTGYSLTQTFPTNFASLSITAGGLVDITQAAADKAWGTTTRTLSSAANITSTGGTITVSTGQVTVATNNDKAGYSISGTKTTLDALQDLSATQVATELTTIGLDHLVSTSVIGADIADNSIIARMASKSATADWDSFNNTTDSLEAISDALAGSASDWSSGEKEQIRSALGVDGTKTAATGGQLQGKSTHSAADVWTSGTRTLTAFGFSVTVGTNNDKTGYSLANGSIVTATFDAGAINSTVAPNLDAAISSRASDASLSTHDTDIKARLPALLVSGRIDASVGNMQTDSLTNTAIQDGAITVAKAPNLDAAITTRSSHSAADVWTSGTRTLTSAANITSTGGTITVTGGAVTVGTNNDKTGYSLTQAFPANFADLAITASTGLVSVGTNNDKAGYSISGTKTTLDALNDISVANVWAEALPAGYSPGEAGYILGTNLDAQSSDILDSVTNIAIGSSAINVRADTFTITGGKGNVVAGTIDDTKTSNNVYHQIEDVGTEMEIYYEFDVGGTGVPASVTIEGRINGNNDHLTVWGWNWVTSSWDQIGNITGQVASTDNTYTFNMFQTHVGSGVDLGKVRVRFLNDGAHSGSDFYVDLIFVSYASVLSADTIADTVWAEALPGLYGAGEAGEILGNLVSGGDWTSGELEQIRDALGVDGTKTAAVGGQLQGKSTHTAADVWSVVSREITGGTVTTVNDKTGYSLANGSIDTATFVAGAINSTVAPNLDAAITSRSSHAAADVWTVGTRELTGFSFSVTVGTNNDKTGYSLTQVFPNNFADLAITATSGLVTITNAVVDWTSGEREQIRDSLGINGDKTAASGGQLQNKSEHSAADVWAVGTREITGGVLPWQAAWDVEVESEVSDALVAAGLDHLVSAAVTGADVADDSIVAKLASKAATADWDTFDNADDSLEAISDATVIVDNDAIAAAVWSEPLPGLADPGEAGHILGNLTVWTDLERDQIREALGVDGDKTAATGGQLQTLPTRVWTTPVLPELTAGIPAVTPTPSAALMRLFMVSRNDIQVNAVTGLKEFRNDAGSVIWKKKVTSTSTLYREEKGEGP